MTRSAAIRAVALSVKAIGVGDGEWAHRSGLGITRQVALLDDAVLLADAYRSSTIAELAKQVGVSAATCPVAPGLPVSAR